MGKIKLVASGVLFIVLSFVFVYGCIGLYEESQYVAAWEEEHGIAYDLYYGDIAGFAVFFAMCFQLLVLFGVGWSGIAFFGECKLLMRQRKMEKELT